MKIVRILNNNVVQAIDDGKEVIVTGKGIAFNAKEHGDIDTTKIEKVFFLKDETVTSHLESIMKEIPENFWEFGIKVVEYIELHLSLELSESFYVAFVDHIYTASLRVKQSIALPDIFSAETKYIFPEVYKVAVKVVELMSEEFDLQFDESEAGFITLHIIDAQSDIVSSNSYITQLISDILEVIKKILNICPSNETTNGTRFLIHLKYLANKIYDHKELENQSIYSAIFKSMVRDFPKQYACILEIKNMVERKYGHSINTDEQCYLLIHLAKISGEQE